MYLLGLMVHLVWSLVWGCVLKSDGSSCKVKRNVSFKAGSGSVGSHRTELGLAAHSQTTSHRNSWAMEVPGTKRIILSLSLDSIYLSLLDYKTQLVPNSSNLGVTMGIARCSAKICIPTPFAEYRVVIDTQLCSLRLHF